MEKKKVCAAVLAGGFGKRLSPLTDGVPKPLMKILNKTVLDCTLEKLRKEWVSSVAVSVFYKWQMISEHLKGRENVSIVHETVPLGTAGGAKLCMASDADYLLVLSGDGVWDFDLDKIADFHFASGADVTIVSTHSETPTRFGVILTDENGNVTQLIEKPSWRNVVSDVVNTGIYLLSRRAMEEIPDRVAYDFSAQLFPKLIKSGYKVKTITLDGYWCDMGTLDEYLSCSMDACFGRIKTLPNTADAKHSLTRVGIHAKDAVFLGEGAVIGCNVVMEGGLVAGDNCDIGENTKISRSVMGDNVKIGRGSDVCSSLLGDDVTVGENCIIAEGCVIEQGSKIPEGTVLEKNTTVYRTGTMLDNSGMHCESVLFNEDGVLFFTGEKAYDSIMKSAFCLVKALNEAKGRHTSVGIICDGADNSLMDGFAKVCSKGGADVFCFKNAQACQVQFACVYYPNDVTVCISRLGEGYKVEMYETVTGRLSDSLERKITKLYGSFTQHDENETAKGKITVVEGFNGVYGLVLEGAVRYMSGSCPCLKGMRVNVVSEKNGTEHVLEGVLRHFEDKNTDEEKQELWVNTDKWCIKSRDAYADAYHMYAAVLDNLQYIGVNKGYIDEDSPDAYRYILTRSAAQFEVVAENSKVTPFDNLPGLLLLRDRCFCLAALLCIMSVRRMSLFELISELPSFEIYSDTFLAQKNRAASMQRLCSLYGIGERLGSGVTVKLSDGNVTVIPDRVRGFKIISEAHSMETARELCTRIAKAIMKEDDK